MQSFLPAFSAAKYKPSFAFNTLKKFFIIILTLSAFVTIFANFITNILAFGFSMQAKQIAAPLIAINFYYLDFIFLVTFLAALLQYKNHFATTSFSTALLNISLIISLLLARDKPPVEIIYYMSIGVLVGGLLQLLAHLVAAYRFGIIKLLLVGCKSPKVDTQVQQKFNKAFLPSIFGNSTAHISAFLDTWLATFLVSGSISYLYYANRLFQLPLALFAIATSIAIFPKIAKYLNNNAQAQAMLMMKKSFILLLVLLGIASIIGIVGAKPIVELLFQRGEFDANDTYHTARVLQMYMIGLLPFGLSKIFLSYLYSTHLHLKAAKISAISLGWNIIFSLILIYPLQACGLALASSLSGYILFALVIKEFGFDRFKKLMFD